MVLITTIINVKITKTALMKSNAKKWRVKPIARFFTRSFFLLIILYLNKNGKNAFPNL